MQIEERLKELKEKINEKVPRGITVTQVEFEGPELVIYTDDPKRFADEADLIKILARDLRKKMDAAAENMRFEEAASIRDLLHTVEEIEQRQKMAAASGDDIDIFAVYAEPPLVAVNLFHLRNGQIVDRRQFYWEDQEEFDEPQFIPSLLKQIYLDQQYIPGEIHIPVDFEDREALEELLSEKRNRRVEIVVR